MTGVLASMAEIIRVGGWSLRGLGYPLGVAERAVRHLAWAEAVHGGVVRGLRATDARFAVARSPARREHDEHGWRVDAAGRDLMELGPPVVDLLTADARERGFGQVAVSGAFGCGLVASLCDLAARRGLACVATYRAEEGDVLPDGIAPAGWVAAWPSGDAPAFATGSMDDVDGVVAWLMPAVPETGWGAVGIQFLAVPDGSRGDGPEPARTDYAARLASAYRGGVRMAADDLAHLYELERRTWAPTSERSRAQAGYGKY